MSDSKLKRDQELAALREKKLTTVFNRHFSEAAAAIAAERKAAEVALREIERRRAEAALKLANSPKKDGDIGQTLTKLDEMYMELKRREESVRKRERDTLQKYHKYMNKGESSEFFFSKKMGSSTKSKPFNMPNSMSTGAPAIKGSGAYKYAKSDIEKGNVDKNVKKFSEHDTVSTKAPARDTILNSGNVKSAADKLNNVNNSVTFTEENEVQYSNKLHQSDEFDPENPAVESKPIPPSPKKKGKNSLSLSEETLFQNAQRAAALAEHDGKVEESNLQAKVAERNARKMARSMSSWGQEDESDNLTVTSYGNSSFGETGSVTTFNSLANSQASSLIFISEAEMRLTAFLKANTEAIVSLSNHVQSTSEEYSDTNSVFTKNGRKEYDDAVLAAEKAAKEMAATVLITSNASVISENTIARKKRKEKWFQYWSEEHSREYYYQPSTGKVVWDPPTEYEDSGTMVKKSDVEKNIATEEEKIQYNIQNWSMDDFLPERKSRKKFRKSLRKSNDDTSSRGSWGSRRSKGSRGSRNSRGSKSSRGSRSKADSVPLTTAILAHPEKKFSIWNSKNRKLRKKVVRRTIWGLVFTGVAYKAGTHTYSFYTSNSNADHSLSSEAVMDANAQESIQALSAKKKTEKQKKIDKGVPKIVEAKAKKDTVKKSSKGGDDEKVDKKTTEKNVKSQKAEQEQKTKIQTEEMKPVESTKDEETKVLDEKKEVDLTTEKVKTQQDETQDIVPHEKEINESDVVSKKGEIQTKTSNNVVNKVGSKKEFDDMESKVVDDITIDAALKESLLDSTDSNDIVMDENSNESNHDIHFQESNAQAKIIVDIELQDVKNDSVQQQSNFESKLVQPVGNSINTDTETDSASGTPSQLIENDMTKQGSKNEIIEKPKLDTDGFESNSVQPDESININMLVGDAESMTEIDRESLSLSESYKNGEIQKDIKNELRDNAKVNVDSLMNGSDEIDPELTLNRDSEQLITKNIFEDVDIIKSQNATNNVKATEPNVLKLDYPSDDKHVHELSNEADISSIAKAYSHEDEESTVEGINMFELSENGVIQEADNMMMDPEVDAAIIRLQKLKDKIHTNVLLDSATETESIISKHSENDDGNIAEEAVSDSGDSVQDKRKNSHMPETYKSVDNDKHENSLNSIIGNKSEEKELLYEDHVHSMSSITEDPTLPTLEKAIDAKNQDDSQLLLNLTSPSTGQELSTNPKQSLPKADEIEKSSDIIARKERRPIRCSIPLIYLLSPVCNLHAKRNPLFDLQGLTDAMMQ